MSEPGSKNTVRFRISAGFMQFRSRFIERNRFMIELDNHDDFKTLLRPYNPDVYRLIGHRYLELHKGLEAEMEEAAGPL